MSLMERLGFRPTRAELELTIEDCEKRVRQLAVLDPKIMQMANRMKQEDRDAFLASCDLRRKRDRDRAISILTKARIELSRRGITPRPHAAT